MVEFIGEEEKFVNIGEPIVFENKTDSDFEVNMGVIFHKSGLYEISITGKRIIVSNAVERKKGKWIDTGSGQECNQCHEIQYGYDSYRYFCSNCGADMRGESNE